MAEKLWKKRKKTKEKWIKVVEWEIVLC